jgi:hypothetical protein
MVGIGGSVANVDYAVITSVAGLFYSYLKSD